MNILRWIATRLLAAGLWLSLTLIATSTIVLATVFNPQFLSTTLDKSGLYDNVVANALKLASAKTNDQDKAKVTDLVGDLTPTAEKVLTLEVLKTNVEKVINGFGDWLKGKTDLPEFSIDTASLRTSLNAALADFLSVRIASLPPCPVNNDVPSYDLLTTECKPPVELAQADYANAANDITKDIPLFEKDQFNSSEVIKDNDAWQNIPVAYHWASFVPYILGAIAAVFAGLILLITRDRARALRRIGHIFLSNGVVLLIVGAILALYLGRNSFDFIANGSTVEQAEFIQKTAVPLIRHLSTSLGSWLLYFGVSYAVIGAGCYFGAHFIRLRRKKANNAPVDATESLPTTVGDPLPVLDPSPFSEQPETVEASATQPTGPPPLAKDQPAKKPPLVQ